MAYDRKAKNSVLVQSMRLMSQQSQSDTGVLEDSWRAAGLQSVLESPKVGSNTDGGMPQQQGGCTCQPGKGTQAQGSFFFPRPFIWRMPSEGAARCRVGLPASDNVIKKIPHRSAPQF